MAPRDTTSNHLEVCASVSSNENDSSANQQEKEEPYETTPEDAVITIRWSMTAVTVLLFTAAVLTALIARNFRLVLVCFWLVLLFLWGALACVLQSITHRRRVFHPIVHDAADWLTTQLDDFVQDCRDETLLLLRDGDTVQTSGRRPRTRLFRWAAPLLRPLIRRRRRRRRGTEAASEAERI